MLPKVKQNAEHRGDFLPYELDYIPGHFERIAKSELFEDEETRIHSLRLLKSMLKDEPGLSWPDEDLFMLSFLRARKFDVKRAFHLVKNFYTVMGKRREVYYSYNFEEVKRTIERDECAIKYLPYRDSQGCVVLVVPVGQWNVELNSMKEEMRVLTSVLVHAITSPVTQIAGFKAIADFKGFTMGRLRYVSPTYLWLIAEALTNCFPGRFKGVHVVNEDVTFSFVWTVLKQFLTKKIKERCHFHGKNVKKLHKYFSPDILPAEYGGTAQPFTKEEFMKLMEEKAEYFTNVFSHGYQKYKNLAQEEVSVGIDVPM